MEAVAYMTRQDIVNFPFPYKLWLVVHIEFCDFLRWNRDGTVILLDLVALEDYLNSTRSIFKIKNSSVFLEHLDEFKFDRLNATPEAEEDLLLQYKSENFQRHRLDLLAKIRRHTYQLIGEIPIENCVNSDVGIGTSVDQNNEKPEAAKNWVSERMLGDLCFMLHGGLSNIQLSRLRFQTILYFQNETRLLEKKLQASDERAAKHRRGKSDISTRSTVIGIAGAADEDQVIELSVDLFENPHDSVLHLDEDFRPEYAGYYGNCSKEQIMHFFGDYLPMYEDGSMEVKKIVADNITPNNISFRSDQEMHMKQSDNTIGEENNSVMTSTPIVQHSIINLNFSSGLEPIFKTEEELENITHLNTNNVDNETEISMDEFIKFKHSPNESFGNDKEIKDEYQEINNCDTGGGNEEYIMEQGVATKDFSQMPAAVKMEIQENTVENEANFRNFFSQYRASLNLLYERH